MPDFVDFRNRVFSCRIGGNAAHETHRAGYNGVWRLAPEGESASLFVPEVAGLNLEHYFDGWHNGARDIFFEPRVAPMEVEPRGERSVVLRQAPTPFWGVESETLFTVREPNIIDLEFRCTPRRAVFNNGVMGVFWASYINRPTDNPIHFFGRAADGSEGWQTFASVRHGAESSVRSRGDAVTLQIAESQRDKLFSSVTPIRWLRPYYYGRWRDQVYVVMFRTRELLRFAMSPSGGGQGNPAWDFQMLVSGVVPDQEYRIEARCVVDRWQGQEWVEQQVEAWR